MGNHDLINQSLHSKSSFILYPVFARQGNGLGI